MEEVKKVPDEETGGGRQNTMKILDKREEAWEEKKKSDGWNGYHVLFTDAVSDYLGRYEEKTENRLFCNVGIFNLIRSLFRRSGHLELYRISFAQRGRAYYIWPVLQR